MKPSNRIEKTIEKAEVDPLIILHEKKQSVNDIIKYVKDISIKSKQIKHFEAQLKIHNDLVLKHEDRMNEFFTTKALSIREDIFKQEIKERISNTLEEFYQRITELMKTKVDKHLFYEKLHEKQRPQRFEQNHQDNQQLREISLTIQWSQFHISQNKQNLLDCPTRSEFLDFSNQVVKKPELEELKYEIERTRLIVEALEAEMSHDNATSGDYKDQEYSDETESMEQADIVGEIEPIAKSEGRNSSSLERSLNQGSDKQIDVNVGAIDSKDLDGDHIIHQKSGVPPHIRLAEAEESKQFSTPFENLQFNKTKQPKSRTSLENMSKVSAGKTPRQVNPLKITEISNMKKEKSNEEESVAGSNLLHTNTINSSNRAASVLNRSGVKRQAYPSYQFYSIDTMSSKVTGLSKRKRVGLKGKIEDILNRMGGAELNIQKLLENVWNIKSKDKESSELLHQIHDEVTEFKEQFTHWQETQREIVEKSYEIEEHYEKAKQDVKNSIAHTETTERKFKKTIDSFVSRYSDGLIRIVKCETNIRQNELQLKKLQKDLKQSHTSLDHVIDSDSMNAVKNLMDSKFETLYSQLQDMASEQARFNYEIHTEVDRIQSGIKDEVIQIKQRE